MMAIADDSKTRFTHRVEAYVAGRPTYPRALIDVLHACCGFDATWRVLDVGAGTGISSRLFLENGNAVTAAEPNAAMRSAAEEGLAGFSNYRSVAAPAEALPLSDGSCDLITAAQAFHWFDHAIFAAECNRLLTPRGRVALFWNNVDPAGGGIARAYDDLIHQFATDLEKVQAKWVESDRVARLWFEPSTFATADLRHELPYSVETFIDRLASSSFMPHRGHARFDEMVAAARRVHEEYQIDGKAMLPYACRVFVGRPLAGGKIA